MSTSKTDVSKLPSSKNNSKVDEKPILNQTDKNKIIDQMTNLNLKEGSIQKSEHKGNKTILDNNQDGSCRSPLVKQKTQTIERYSIR